MKCTLCHDEGQVRDVSTARRRKNMHRTEEQMDNQKVVREKAVEGNA
jgi:hypothetical protein